MRRDSSHVSGYNSKWMLAMIFVAGIFISGCATRAIQTEQLLEAKSSEALRQFEVPNVPFIDQTEGYCGPATLAMTLGWAGRSVDVRDLAKQVFTPGQKGAMPQDLVGATRRQGMMGVQINGLPVLIQEISAGHPVIVFENLALTWYPRWHYAVAYGFDLDRETITLHSGSEQAKHWSLHKFERSWMLGEYWGLVVLPPGQISVAAGELANTTAAAGLEQLGKIAEAGKSYRTILEKWPRSLGASIGLGNITYSQKDFRESVSVLESASRIHPSSAVVWHNLATAQGADGLKSAARKSAKRALELATTDELVVFRESLKEWL